MCERKGHQTPLLCVLLHRSTILCSISTNVSFNYNNTQIMYSKSLYFVSATNTTLRVLDLQWNQIRKDTAKSICKALAVG